MDRVELHIIFTVECLKILKGNEKVINNYKIPISRFLDIGQ